ncbi:hypothetical protein GCM10011450_02820 [Advenella faeciporci]|uniref:DUF2061 domain-containing protein n=2 Tax=Advenella faeciporci TaxID=797535 RepID=A0A918JEC9_9BURK|nr:hypothetical protein GCM10011450_02820 [Advenella faeciporci]
MINFIYIGNLDFPFHLFNNNDYHLIHEFSLGNKMIIIEKISQTLLHMSVAFTVTFVFTGSVSVGGLAALVEPVCNVLLLPLHDRAWKRIRMRLAKSNTNTALAS